MRARRHSYLTHLECAHDGERYDAQVVQNRCRCGAPLLARYDLDAARAELSRAELAGRAPDLWRYRELLPVRDPARVLTLGEGMTPLLPLKRLGAEIGVPGLLVKDESPLPTGSFKARGAAVGVARAAELGVTRVAMPTNGNAGAAWAAYAARAGLRLFTAMPLDSPEVTRRECVAYGAQVELVHGSISDAGARVREVLEGGGRRGAGELGGARWFDASTLKEPYRVEGKKTMALEIAEQLGWRLPDVVVYPTGGGVGLLGIAKAAEELRVLGWVDGPPPRLVAVQASGCAPIVRAFERGAGRAEPWADPATVAFGINVPAPLGGDLVLHALRASAGTALAVDDADIVAAVARSARTEGLLPCPEGAATLVAVERLRSGGWLDGSERVVVLNTGAGVKYPEALPVS